MEADQASPCSLEYISLLITWCLSRELGPRPGHRGELIFPFKPEAFKGSISFKAWVKRSDVVRWGELFYWEFGKFKYAQSSLRPLGFSFDGGERQLYADS